MNILNTFENIDFNPINYADKMIDSLQSGRRFYIENEKLIEFSPRQTMVERPSQVQDHDIGTMRWIIQNLISNNDNPTQFSKFSELGKLFYEKVSKGYCLLSPSSDFELAKEELRLRCEPQLDELSSSTSESVVVQPDSSQQSNSFNWLDFKDSLTAFDRAITLGQAGSLQGLSNYLGSNYSALQREKTTHFSKFSNDITNPEELSKEEFIIIIHKILDNLYLDIENPNLSEDDKKLCKEVGKTLAMLASSIRTSYKANPLLETLPPELQSIISEKIDPFQIATFLHALPVYMQEVWLKRINHGGVELYQLGINTIEEVIEFTSKFPIENLDLRFYMDQVNDEHIHILTKTCPYVKSLLISSKNITDQALIDVTNKFTQLINLSISNCSDITDESIFYIAKNLTNLTSLDLSFLYQITDLGLYAIATRLTQLKSLNLAVCDRITDEGLSIVAKFLTELTELNLWECKQITDTTLFAISNLTKLRNLNLSTNRSITDKGIAVISDRLRHLTSLDLNSCDKLTPLSLVSITKLSQLEKLNLSEFQSLDDDALLAIAENLTLLTNLELTGNYRITDRSINAVANKLPLLTYLNLSWCPSVTQESIHHLKQTHPFLNVIDNQEVDT